MAYYCTDCENTVLVSDGEVYFCPECDESFTLDAYENEDGVWFEPQKI